MASAGDLSGDGIPDILLGDDQWGVEGNALLGAVAVALSPGTAGYVPFEEADGFITGLADGDLFGLSLAPAGDVDDDGFGDFLVGAPFHADDAGAAVLWSGGGP